MERAGGTAPSGEEELTMTTTQPGSAARALRIFSSRLETLARLLDVAAKQWRDAGRDPEALRTVRLAEDMLPLTHQIVFTCNQAHDFVTWCTGTEAPKPDADALAYADLKPHVEATLARLAAATPQITDALVARDRRVNLMHGMYVDLSGADYLDDWLLPNFYFHLVTAYDLLRREGVSIGKADYMAHLHGRVQRP
jgi:hypothetical protein